MTTNSKARVTHDCDAMIYGSTIYFGPLLSVPELYEAHVGGKAHYCNKDAKYEVGGSRACASHLGRLLESETDGGAYVDKIVPVRVL